MVWGKMGLLSGALLCALFNFAWSSVASALNTPLSNCPKAMLAARFVAEIDAHPEWTDEQLVRKFYDYQLGAIRALVPHLERQLADVQEAVRAPFLSTEVRAERAREFQKVKHLLGVCRNQQVTEREIDSDLELLRGDSLGEIFVHLVRFSAPSLFDEVGIEMASAEQARALMSAVIARNRPVAVVRYIPQSREAAPKGEVKRRLEELLRDLGGKDPSPHLLDSLWSRSLVRPSMYSSRWGRMEIYWELVQSNGDLDLRDELTRGRIALYVDKVEELLLRPRPVCDGHGGRHSTDSNGKPAR